MQLPINFYMDDSGTRKPDRAPTPFIPAKPDHFSLGGVMVLEERENEVEAAHRRLCEKWGITYPLHLMDMRFGAKNFSWLRRESKEYEPSMDDLTRMLTSIPVTGLPA